MNLAFSQRQKEIVVNFVLVFGGHPFGSALRGRPVGMPLFDVPLWELFGHIPLESPLRITFWGLLLRSPFGPPPFWGTHNYQGNHLQLPFVPITFQITLNYPKLPQHVPKMTLNYPK